LIRRTAVLAVLVLAIAALAAGVAVATDATTGGSDAELLRQGQDVYAANCVACHQADGGGIAGAFPALTDNPRVDDAGYVEQVLRNGSTAVADPDAFSGIMIAFATLSDDDVAAVIAYLQAGLVVPGGAGEPVAQPEDLAGTKLPLATVVTMTVAFLAFLAVAALVVVPSVLIRNDRHEFDAIRSWSKAIIIFLFFVVATVVVPSLVLQWGPVSRAPRLVQDLVGSGLWLGALGVGLWALRRGQRERVL